MNGGDKNSKDSLFKTLLSAVASNIEFSQERSRNGGRIDINAAKDLVGSLASIAGKGKDDLMQALFREIGQAVAAMLTEPVTQILAERKLSITVELVAKDKVQPNRKKSASKKKPSASKKTSASKKSSSKSKK
jgi:hypothetical protein